MVVILIGSMNWNFFLSKLSIFMGLLKIALIKMRLTINFVYLNRGLQLLQLKFLNHLIVG